MADGNSHDSQNLPLMLIGSREHFRFQGGRHLRYEHEPAASLLVTVLDKLGVPGVPVERIANSRDPLDLAAPPSPLAGI